MGNGQAGGREHRRGVAAAVADMMAVRAGQGEDIVLIGVEGSPSMGVHVTSSDPARGGLPEWPAGTSELTSGEGIFVEELRAGLGRRGIAVGLGGETHALPDHDERTQRARLEVLLEDPLGPAKQGNPGGRLPGAAQ
jgi:hypothetical protein